MSPTTRETRALRLLVVGVLIGGGLWASGVGMSELLDLARLSSVPEQSLEEPRPGPARLRGHVAPLDELLETPEGVAVVYHRRERQTRRRTSDDRPYWHTEDREDRWVDFLVTDGISALPVRPTSREVFALPMRTIESSLLGRTVEWRLEPGDALLVVGMLQPGAGGMELVFDAPGYFHPLVSLGDDEETRRELLLWGSVLLWLGTCLLLLGAVFTWLVWGGMRVLSFLGLAMLITGALPLALGAILLADDRARQERQEAWLREHVRDPSFVVADRGSPGSSTPSTRLSPMVAAPALLGALLLLGWSGLHGVRHARDLRAIRRTQVTRGPLPDSGLVAIQGTIETVPGVAPLEAPLTGRTCVWYRHVLSVRKSRGWQEEEAQTRHVPFLCTGRSGNVRVDPTGASVSSTSMSTRESGATMRHEERLSPGHRLYALGTLSHSGDPDQPPVLGKGPRGTPFILSNDTASATADGRTMMGVVHMSLFGCGLSAAMISLLGIRGELDPWAWLTAGLAPAGLLAVASLVFKAFVRLSPERTEPAVHPPP